MPGSKSVILFSTYVEALFSAEDELHRSEITVVRVVEPSRRDSFALLRTKREGSGVSERIGLMYLCADGRWRATHRYPNFTWART